MVVSTRGLQGRVHMGLEMLAAGCFVSFKALYPVERDDGCLPARVAVRNQWSKDGENLVSCTQMGWLGSQLPLPPDSASSHSWS